MGSADTHRRSFGFGLDPRACTESGDILEKLLRILKYLEMKFQTEKVVPCLNTPSQWVDRGSEAHARAMELGWSGSARSRNDGRPRTADCCSTLWWAWRTPPMFRESLLCRCWRIASLLSPKRGQARSGTPSRPASIPIIGSGVSCATARGRRLVQISYSKPPTESWAPKPLRLAKGLVRLDGGGAAAIDLAGEEAIQIAVDLGELAKAQVPVQPVVDA